MGEFASTSKNHYHYDYIMLLTSMNASLLKLKFQINFVTSYHFIDYQANLVSNMGIFSIT